MTSPTGTVPMTALREATNKIHKIKSREGAWKARVTTYCGLVGQEALNTNTEFETVRGDRFEAVTQPSIVTCNKCKKANP